MKTELLKTVRRYPGEFYIGQGRGAWVHIWSKPREIIREARKSLKKRQRRVGKSRAAPRQLRGSVNPNSPRPSAVPCFRNMRLPWTTRNCYANISPGSAAQA